MLSAVLLLWPHCPTSAVMLSLYSSTVVMATLLYISCYAVTVQQDCCYGHTALHQLLCCQQYCCYGHTALHQLLCCQQYCCYGHTALHQLLCCQQYCCYGHI